jgi:hypothetical protein
MLRIGKGSRSGYVGSGAWMDGVGEDAGDDERWTAADLDAGGRAGVSPAAAVRMLRLTRLSSDCRATPGAAPPEA